MNVVARFIKVQESIFNVSDIMRVFVRYQYGGLNTIIVQTHSGDDDGETKFDGDIRDEIWELLQLGSDTHLDPDDKLREMVVPQ